jgi:hypothetical protein
LAGDAHEDGQSRVGAGEEDERENIGVSQWVVRRHGGSDVMNEECVEYSLRTRMLDRAQAVLYVESPHTSSWVANHINLVQPHTKFILLTIVHKGKVAIKHRLTSKKATNFEERTLCPVRTTLHCVTEQSGKVSVLKESTLLERSPSREPLLPVLPRILGRGVLVVAIVIVVMVVVRRDEQFTQNVERTVPSGDVNRLDRHTVYFDGSADGA